MFKIVSIVFKYVFIFIIYFFIYSIIKLIYLDIRGLSFITEDKSSYIKLITDMDEIDYLIKEYYILNRKLSIGRSIGNDVVVGSPYVSKKHLVVENIDNKKYVLRDLNSANGTYLNGKRVLGEVELKNSDIIGVGDIEFKFINR